MTSERILEVETLLQALSEELLKLKSASEHYEETKENLQKMCESLDKISLTHQKLTDNIKQVLGEMEKTNLENQRREAAVEASLTKKYDDIVDEVRKQTEIIHKDKTNQSKSLRLIKSLIVLGIVIEAVVIIRIVFF